MTYTQFDYGYISALGQLFIPQAMQRKSQIKAYQYNNDNNIVLVKCEIEGGYIVIRHHDTLPYDEYRKMQGNMPKDVRAIDELGRVILARGLREALRIASHDAVKIYLSADGAIRVRPLVI